MLHYFDIGFAVVITLFTGLGLGYYITALVAIHRKTMWSTPFVELYASMDTAGVRRMNWLGSLAWCLMALGFNYVNMSVTALVMCAWMVVSFLMLIPQLNVYKVSSRISSAAF